MTLISACRSNLIYTNIFHIYRLSLNQRMYYCIHPQFRLRPINSNPIERFLKRFQQSQCPFAALSPPRQPFLHSANHFVMPQDFQQSQQCDIPYTYILYRFCDKFTIEIFEDV